MVEFGKIKEQLVKHVESSFNFQGEVEIDVVSAGGSKFKVVSKPFKDPSNVYRTLTIESFGRASLNADNYYDFGLCLIMVSHNGGVNSTPLAQVKVGKDSEVSSFALESDTYPTTSY